MRLRPLLAAAMLAIVLFPVRHALAFTVTEQSGSSSDGSSRVVDPDEQLNIFGWQGQTQGSDRNANSPNQTPNGSNNQTPLFPNLFAPLTQPRR